MGEEEHRTVGGFHRKDAVLISNMLTQENTCFDLLIQNGVSICAVLLLRVGWVCNDE